MKSDEIFDLVVIGAGAAGLMAAMTAGATGKKVLVLDHADNAGKKILISGGGRCNFTNRYVSATNYLSENPHFAKSALERYTPADFLLLLERHKIRWHEKTLGQLFCDESARNVLAMLLSECAKAGVEIRLGQNIADISGASPFCTSTDVRRILSSSLVIATGGVSIPKMGATGFAYRVAEKYGVKIEDPRPALVPLTLGPEYEQFLHLAGVSTTISAKFGKVAFKESILFTHKGLSGPAILQISSYWQPGKSIFLDFTPQQIPEWLCKLKGENPKISCKTAFAREMPARLAATLSRALPDGPIGALSDKVLTEITAKISNWPVAPSGTYGFSKAEVTAGGVSTSALSSKTMEVRKVPGLYFIGEAVDVTGWLGGYNFQWAWASGYACGTAIKNKP